MDIFAPRSDMTGQAISMAYCGVILLICSIKCSFKYSRLRLGISLGTLCTLFLAVGNGSRTWMGIQAEGWFWGVHELINAALLNGVVILLLSVGNNFYLKVDEKKPALWKLSVLLLLIFDVFTILEIIPVFAWQWHNPDLVIYIVHQIFTLLTIFFPVLYVYIPMVRRSTEGLDVANPSTMATGVWYLIANGLVATVFFSVFAYYWSRPDRIFSPTAVAWSCCIEATVGLIIALPPFPPFLWLLKIWVKERITARLSVQGGDSSDYTPSRRRSSAMTLGGSDVYPDFLVPGLDPSMCQLAIPVPPLPVIVRDMEDTSEDGRPPSSGLEGRLSWGGSTVTSIEQQRQEAEGNPSMTVLPDDSSK
ncbi:hypothetical protein BC936DRAFT_139232 [Jimgerdemannia flammicorona]|uniref:Uncharacterized protein n=2 Tax=Jimgerdemannia flammicorona TaxID=994334 RepID=A0A433QFJ9_9FUNG|nr:hypothetical protein BC936DRAFT_139232 [Jimgerdemannia flammicorona]RUS28539.1 hypothetical protein BC938DRAFT_481766 [Jimgerdemannia flammicorona]